MSLLNGLGAYFDDVRCAWRRLRHSPGFTIVALLTVMLTVGANTAILSVADAVLFRPLPYADAGNVAIIQVRDKKSGRQATLTPYAYLEAINDSCPSVSDVALLEPFSGKARPTIQTADGQTSVPAMEATPQLFRASGRSGSARPRVFHFRYGPRRPRRRPLLFGLAADFWR